MISDDVIIQLNEFMPSLGTIFKTIFLKFISGENVWDLEQIWDFLKEILKNEFYYFRVSFINLILLLIIASVLTRINNLFKNRQLTDLTYLLLQLSMLRLLLTIFQSMVLNITELFHTVISFTEILIPVFYLSVALQGQVASANYFYHFTVLLLYAVSILFPKVLLPAISCYVFVGFLGSLSSELKLNKIKDLIKRGIVFFLKCSIGIVGGIGIVKSMVFPAIDETKTGVAVKIMKGIPGIGDVSDSVSGIMIGSAKIIKEGLGGTILILMVLFMIIPVIRVFFVSLIMKIILSVASIAGDKKMVDCADGVSEGGFLLVKSALTFAASFFVIIALVSLST